MAVSQPVVRFLKLVPGLNQLTEHAIFVADPVAGDRELKRGAAVEETGGKTTESAIAKTRIIFNVSEFFKIQPKLIQSLLCLRIQPQIEHSVAKRSAHQEFERKVIGPAAVGLPISLLGILKPFH